MSSNRRVDWAKPLVTRAGSVARIIAFDKGLPKPVIGAYGVTNDETGEIEWFLCNWRHDGFYLPSKSSSLDVINA